MEEAVSRSQCHKCTRVLPSGSLVRLWDGRNYCDSCLNAVGAELAQYARDHDTLEETMPHASSQIALRRGKQGAIVVAAWTVSLLLVAWYELPNVHFLLRIAIATTTGVATGAPVVALFSAGARAFLDRRRPTVSVADGIVRVRIGEEVSRARLSECYWFEGTLLQMNALATTGPQQRFLPLPAERALILVLPGTSHRRAMRVAVGYTRASRLRWEAFLVVARVPRDRPEATK